MNDLISRREAIRLYCREQCGWEPEKCPLRFERDGAEECSVVRLLKELPSAQLEQKHGRWMVNKSDGYIEFAPCSECGEVHDVDFLYCPNCGARMDGD